MTSLPNARTTPTVHCDVCGCCSWSPAYLSECPHCAELAGRKALQIGCPHHEGDDPESKLRCWQRWTDHCSICRGPLAPGDAAWQYMPIASAKQCWGPVWCDGCVSERGKESGEWQRFQIYAAKGGKTS